MCVVKCDRKPFPIAEKPRQAGEICLFLALLILSALLLGMGPGYPERLASDMQHVPLQFTEDPSTNDAAVSLVPDPDSLTVAATTPLLNEDSEEPVQEEPQALLWRFTDVFNFSNDEPEAASDDASADIHEFSSTMEIVRDHKVDRHIRYFHGDIRDRFEQWLTRLGRYRPMVEQVFAEFDLPLDLVYLSLVESGFNPRAYSRARATGPWQFMKGTARRYGLRINYYVDERRDPIKSTVAAAQHLRDLYDTFGSWPLAMAAYNAGEGKVRRALQKTNSETFQEIARTRYLRRETREYVPRIMAATIIANDPERYGFSSDQPDPYQFEEVVVSRPLHLRDIARATRLSYRELRSLNPELRRYVTPPRDKAYHLKVPVGTKAKIASILDQIPSWKRSIPPRMKKGSKVPKGWYRVQMGDSLWKIAKRFRLSVRELKARNNLRGWLIRPGDLLAIR